MMTEPRYDNFAEFAKDSAGSSDAQIIGLLKTWKKILKSTNDTLAKAVESHENSISIYTAFKAIAYARGLEITDEDLYINE